MLPNFSARRRAVAVALLLTATAAAGQNRAPEAATGTATDAAPVTLLQGSVRDGDGAALAFELSGPSREQPLGGEMRFGDRRFVIDRVSVHSLIGASRRFDGGEAAEYAIFSSSYSAQTATGTPWIAARRYLHCEQPYNSFLALHRVDGADNIVALEDRVYATLQESVDHSTSSTVYCFFSQPPR